MTTIIIDSRENKQFIKEFTKEEINIEVKQLLTADFIIQTKTINESIQHVGIERKTVSDLLNSIIDKRLINQLIILKENFDIPLLIIEGEENLYKIRDFHPNTIRGIILTVAVDFQIPIIYSRGIKDTCQFLLLLAKRLEKPRKPFSLLDRKKPLTLKEQQLYFIESFPGIGPTIAKSLLKEFRSIKNIINASEGDLKKVDKIGKNKAKLIYKLFNDFFED